MRVVFLLAPLAVFFRGDRFRFLAAFEDFVPAAVSFDLVLAEPESSAVTTPTIAISSFRAGVRDPRRNL
ncbi:MAG TPA: hypothetical protein VK845_11895, partial [Gemmatimonadales bacterium]|nr:hypothetical protein [Gemmatimonadales bacterium]